MIESFELFTYLKDWSQEFGVFSPLSIQENSLKDVHASEKLEENT